MQYLVREIQSNASFGSVQGMIFKTLPDVVKYLKKINREEQLVVGEKEESIAQLEKFLNERLATISLHAAIDKKKQWVVTAFD